MNSNRRFVAICLVALSLNLMASRAQASGQGGVVTSRSTSDHVQGYGLAAEYRSQLLDVSWPYSQEPEQGWAWGIFGAVQQISLSGNKVASLAGAALLGEYKLDSRNQFSLELGGKEISDSQGKTSSAPVGLLSYMFQHTPERLLTLRLERRTLVDDLALAGGASVTLAASSASLHVQQYLMDQRVRLVGFDRQRWISDGNRSNEADVAAYFGTVSPEWLWVGYGVNRLAYRFSSNSYWSPDLVLSHGPRAEASYRIYGSWALNGAAGLSWIRDVSSGTGHQLSAGIQYGSREGTLVKFRATHLDSMRTGSQWSESDLELSLHLKI